MSHRALNGEQFQDHLPPKPGTQPVPEGHVRLFHYTGEEALPSIREKGLSTEHARGSTYGEPNVVWAAAHRETPGHDALYHRPYVEFHAHSQHDLDIGAYGGGLGSRQQTAAPEKLGEHIEHMYGYKSHVTMRGDVPPSRILAVHEPWHAHVHYLESDPRTLHDYTQGDFKDYDTGDPHTDKALAYVRAKHAAGGYK
jgi:hypothetical protein